MKKEIEKESEMHTMPGNAPHKPQLSICHYRTDLGIQKGSHSQTTPLHLPKTTVTEICGFGILKASKGIWSCTLEGFLKHIDSVHLPAVSVGFGIVKKPEKHYFLASPGLLTPL